MKSVLLLTLILLLVGSKGFLKTKNCMIKNFKPCCDFLMQATGMLEPLEMEGGDHGQLLHSELLGALLVAVAVRAPDLGLRSEPLGPGEPLQTVGEADAGRVRDGGQVQRDVPERIDGGGHTLAHLHTRDFTHDRSKNCVVWSCAFPLVSTKPQKPVV